MFAGSKVFDAQGRSHAFVELYELEKEMRKMGMVEGSWVSRKPPSR